MAVDPLDKHGYEVTPLPVLSSHLSTPFYTSFSFSSSSSVSSQPIRHVFHWQASDVTSCVGSIFFTSTFCSPTSPLFPPASPPPFLPSPPPPSRPPFFSSSPPHPRLLLLILIVLPLFLLLTSIFSASSLQPLPPSRGPSHSRYEHTFELYSESRRLYLFGTDEAENHRFWVKSIAKVSSRLTSCHAEMWCLAVTSAPPSPTRCCRASSRHGRSPSSAWTLSGLAG